MVYYGHALQFPELLPCNVNPSSDDTGDIPGLYGHDVDFVSRWKRIRRGSSWVVHTMVRWWGLASVPTIQGNFQSRHQ